MTTAQNLPIAVVGVSALFPGSADKASFWRNILDERDLISDVPPSHWLVEDYYDADPSARDKTYAKRGGFLPAIDFDAMAWGVPPTIMPATDSTQLLALIVAQRVIDDACRGQFGEALRERTSVFLGVTSAQELLGTMVSRLQKPVWVKALREMGLPESQVEEACGRIADHYVEWQESSFPGVLGNVVAGRIANRLDLGGTNCVTDAACASTFSALSMGINELRLGTSDLVIAGGADTMNDIFMYMCFSKTPALSASGDCRPFSDRADGTLLGEGIGMVALKRLADAEREGDRIYAVIKGLGASSDGRAKSVYAPVAEGQARALRRAYEQAGFGPGTVGLVEAHGTGTKAGDAAEFSGLSLVFEEDRAEGGERPWCALGSIKAQIGHTKAAAGAAGLFKAIMALHHRVLPATLKIDRPNPALAIEESPFYLNATTRPWVAAPGAPRRASVSSFGFGGSNFHLALEEYRGANERPARVSLAGPSLLLLSAADVAALGDACRDMAALAEAEGMLAYLARESQRTFDATLDCRLAIVAEDEEALVTKLDNARSMIAAGEPFRSPTGVYFARGATERTVGCLFPGQGSQYVGMGRDVALSFEAARAPWDEAAARSCGGERLHDVVFPRAAFDADTRAAQAAALTATERAQPALAVASLSLWRLLQVLGVTPAAVAGHSFGEVMALHAAGALDSEAALDVAWERGRLMAEAASEPGAMLSVAASLEELADLGDEVVIANHNGPRQVVLSGRVAAIEAAEAKLAAAGLRTTRLDVATAFHSPIVAGAVAPFRRFLEGVPFAAPSTVVYANQHAAPHTDAAMRDSLAEQLASRVRFVETIEAMYTSGVRTFVEVGPGHVLTGLVGRILEGRPHRAVALDRKGRHGIASLWHALAELACAGVPIDCSALWREYGELVDPRAAAPMKMPVPITGTSYGKLYPPAEGAAALPPPNPERPLATPVSAVPPATVALPVTMNAPVATAPPAPAATISAPPAATAPPATISAPPAQAVGRSEWLAAFEIAQRQAAEAQESFQRTLAASHERFMATSEASWNTIAALLTGEAPPAPRAEPAPSPAVSLPAASLPSAPLPSAPLPLAPLPVEPPAPRPEPASPAAAPLDLQALVLDVVAEATGYPKEMIGLDMSLEADLGIDSIKRVEILSALLKRAPSLPELPAGEVGKLGTLDAILGALRAALPGGEGAPAIAAAPQGAAEAPRDLASVVLAAVADKTGYPIEMLGLEMNLEADLGIDSIKRVEILSRVREQAPDLPDVPAAVMASITTLDGVIAALEASHGEPPAPAVAAPIEAAPLAIVSPIPVATAAHGLATPGLAGADIVVVDDGAGVAEALSAALAGHVSLRVIGPDAAIDPATTALIDLAGLHATAGSEAVSLAAFRRAKALAPRFGEQGGLYVIVQDSGGDFGASGGASASGGLVALARTARHEWPAASVRALDVQRGERSPEALARAIAHELLDGGSTPDVGLRADGQRLELADAPLGSASEPAPAALGAGDVVIASGGARGVTAVALIALARETRAAFALLGRSPLVDESEHTRGVEDDAELKRALLAAHRARGATVSPAALGGEVAALLASREVRATLAAIEAAGGRAAYHVADVTDAGAMRRVVDACTQSWGPVTAIVHGAGVLADKRIADKDEASFARVLATKVRGLEALLAACADAPLRQLCVFSSVAARHGNAGQCDYAVANELLNQRAAELARTRPGVRVKSLAWGPWRGGMVTPALSRHFASLGVAVIEPEAGAEAFVAALQRGPDAPAHVLIGGALPARARPRELRVSVCLDAERHAYLGDHRVRGTVVLPIACAIELMARALKSALPELCLVELGTIRVLRGLRLETFDAAPTWLSVAITELTNGEGATARVALLDGEGRERYTATAVLAATRPLVGLAPPPPLEDAAPFEGPIYGGVLFHGLRFRVVEAIERLGPGGATATLRGAQVADGVTDVGLVDGALQLALSWTEAALGGPSLPTGLERVELHGSPAPGLVTAEVRPRAADTGGSRGTCDITLVDAGGQPVVRLFGVETHLLPPAEARPAAAAP